MVALQNIGLGLKIVACLLLWGIVASTMRNKDITQINNIIF